MNKKGEIIIIEDDSDDSEIICHLLQKMNIGNKITCFSNARDSLDYLRKVDADPFFILCDLRMPLINGFELKQMIYADENLIRKAVPFIIYSTTISSADFNTALSVGVQGVFVKPPSIEEFKQLMGTIMLYLNDVMGNPL